MPKKYLGVKITEGLYEKLQEYKRRYDIDSDSEAVRDILRRFLAGDGNG